MSHRDLLPDVLPGGRPIAVTLDQDGGATAAGVLAEGRVTWFGLGHELPDTLNGWVTELEKARSEVGP